MSLERSALFGWVSLVSLLACSESTPVAPTPEPEPPNEFDAAPPGPVTCNGTQCEPPSAELESLGVTRCCTDADECAYRSPVANGCFALGEPGGVSPECESVATTAGRELPGCCTPTGTCGGLDRLSGLGCVPRDAFGLEASSCAPDSTSICSNVAEVVCDGPEDCDADRRCCGRLAEGVYDRFSCFETCASSIDTRGETWFEICDPVAGCGEAGFICEPSSLLPGFLFRCSRGGDASAPDGGDAVAPDGGPVAAAGIRCGSESCAPTSSCCVRPPLDPVCTPAGGCGCDPSRVDAGADAGNLDGSADAADADGAD